MEKDPQQQKDPPRPARKKYEPPAVRSSELFERRSLACGTNTTVRLHCQFVQSV